MGFKLKIKAPKIKLDSKSLSNAGKNLTGFVSPLYAMSQKKPEDMQLPGESPEQTALRKRLYGEAADFRSNLGEMQGEQRNNITRGANQALESGEKGVRTSMNQRGMLYSGMREAGEQGVRANVASTMAKQTMQSNKELEDLANKKEQVAASVGLDSYRESVQRESEIAAQNMANQVARAQAMQQLGQNAGYAMGAYSQRSTTPTTTASTPSTYSTGPVAGNSQYMSSNVAGKSGGAIAPAYEMQGDKHAPQQASAPQPAPSASGLGAAAKMPAPTVSAGGIGSSARAAILNRMRGVA